MTRTNDIHLVPLVLFAHKPVCSYRTGASHATQHLPVAAESQVKLIRLIFFSMTILMVDLSTKICLFPQISRRWGLCYKIHRTGKANKRQLSTAYHLWERKSIVWTKFITLYKRTANLPSVVFVFSFWILERKPVNHILLLAVGLRKVHSVAKTTLFPFSHLKSWKGCFNRI